MGDASRIRRLAFARWTPYPQCASGRLLRARFQLLCSNPAREAEHR